MPSAHLAAAQSRREVFALARLSDPALLTRAKADLATSLAIEFLSARNLPAALGSLSKLVDTIRIFREKTARAAGSKIAVVIAGMFGDGGDGLCKKLKYCARRAALRLNLNRVRNAITMAEVAKELAEIGELLATLIVALASLKLPLSVIFLILLYALDEVCKCPPNDRAPPRKARTK